MLCLNPEYLVFGIKFKEIKLRSRKGGRLFTCTHALQSARICTYISKTPITEVKHGSNSSTSCSQDTMPKHSHRDGAEADNVQQHALGVVIL